MSLCWPLQMPSTAKSVLISLADNANDAGHCWPSIPAIAKRTCFSERAVTNAIHWLEKNDFLIADRDNGRHTKYQLTLQNHCTSFTPAPDSPLHVVHHSPAPDAVVPLNQVQSNRQYNRKEPSLNKQTKKTTLIPEDFAITTAVRTWAKEKGYGGLEKRLEHFKDLAIAKGYKNVNWDAAFKNAIRGDWAKLSEKKPDEKFNPLEYIRRSEERDITATYVVDQ